MLSYGDQELLDIGEAKKRDPNDAVIINIDLYSRRSRREGTENKKIGWRPQSSTTSTPKADMRQQFDSELGKLE